MRRRGDDWKPGRISDYRPDITDRSDQVVFVFNIPGAEYSIVQAYSNKCITQGRFVEPGMRLPDHLLDNTHPMTGCCDARTNIPPVQSLIRLVSSEHFGSLVNIIYLFVKSRCWVFRIGSRRIGFCIISTARNN